MSTVTEVTLIVCSTLVILAAMSNISDVLKSRRYVNNNKLENNSND